MRYETIIEKVRVGSTPGFHREFEIEVIADFNRAIDDMFAELQSRGEQDLLAELCPYFGAVWDSARALSNILAVKPDAYFRGMGFLEIGCGLAIPSMVALTRGAARVTATDMHPDVPDFLRRNLKANGLGDHPGFRYQAVDWRRDKDVLLGGEAGMIDCVLASDVLYDRGQADAVAGFLREAFARGTAQAIVTDPGRPYLQEFVSACARQGLKVVVEIEQVDPVDRRRDVFVLWVDKERILRPSGSE